MFCPKDGSLLIPKKEGKKTVVMCKKGGKITTTCKVCGYKHSSEQNTIKEEVKKPEKDVEVVDRDDVETLPLTEAKCETCGHEKAHYWLVQTRAGDEPETKFLKCEKCGHTWRDYS